MPWLKPSSTSTVLASEGNASATPFVGSQRPSTHSFHPVTVQPKPVPKRYAKTCPSISKCQRSGHFGFLLDQRSVHLQTIDPCTKIRLEPLWPADSNTNLPLRCFWQKPDIRYTTVLSARRKSVFGSEARTSPELDLQTPLWNLCSSLMMSWWSQCDTSCRSWAGCTTVCSRKSSTLKISTEWDLHAMYSAGRSMQWQQQPFLPAPLSKLTQNWIGQDIILWITVCGKIRIISCKSSPMTVSTLRWKSGRSLSSV